MQVPGALSAALEVALGLWLAGCTSVHSPGRAPERHTRAADGVELAWEELGQGTAPQGSPAVLFVHGWCGERGFWRTTMEALAKERRVVALDLGGHGASSAERTTWTLDALADDVVAVANAAELEDVILVGHSMGGPVALLAAPRLLGRVRGVIGVDSLHDPDFAYPPGFLEDVARGLEADFPRALEASLDGVLGPGAPADLRGWLRGRMLRTDRRAAVALLRGLGDFRLADALRGAGVPVRVIDAELEPAAEPSGAIESSRRYADYDAVRLEGVGHFPMLESPSRFLPLLEAWLAELSAPIPR
jgi:sigma-B regulation protein RsbQ